MTDSHWNALLQTLTLHDTGAQTPKKLFTAASLPMPHGRIFGGQVLAQAILASYATIPHERTMHSLHGYFLRPGDANLPLTFSVENIYDGRSFATRRIQGFQKQHPIFSMIASHQINEPSNQYRPALIESIPTPHDLLNRETSGPQAHIQHNETVSPFEVLRFSNASAKPHPTTEHTGMWMRIGVNLPDDPILHKALIAFMSDYSIIDPTLRVQNLSWKTYGLKTASLDHAMWWHESARADRWLCYIHNCLSAGSGRGLNTGSIYTEDFKLVATVTQEAMVRVSQ